VIDFYVNEHNQLNESRRLQQLLDQRQELDKEIWKIATKSAPDMTPVLDSHPVPMTTPTVITGSFDAAAEAAAAMTAPSLEEMPNFNPDIEMAVAAAVAEQQRSAWLEGLSFTTTMTGFAPGSTLVSPVDSFDATPKSTPALEMDHDMLDFLSETACATPALGNGPPFADYFLDPSAQLMPQLPLFLDGAPDTVASSFLPSPQVGSTKPPLVQTGVSAETTVNPSASAPVATPSTGPASVPEMEAFTSVWSLSPHAQPKRRTRRTMTDSEKKEYRVKRLNGACHDCRRRRRKCVHPGLAGSMTPATPATTMMSPPTAVEAQRRVPMAEVPVNGRPSSTVQHIQQYSATPDSVFASTPLITTQTHSIGTEDGAGVGASAAGSAGAAAAAISTMWPDQSKEEPWQYQQQVQQFDSPLLLTDFAGVDAALAQQFVAEGPLSWSDPNLFSLDSDDQGWDVSVPAPYTFQSSDHPPRVSWGHAPQVSSFPAQTNSRRPDNLSQSRSTDGRRRSHYLAPQVQKQQQQQRHHHQASVGYNQQQSFLGASSSTALQRVPMAIPPTPPPPQPQRQKSTSQLPVSQTLASSTTQSFSGFDRAVKSLVFPTSRPGVMTDQESAQDSDTIITKKTKSRTRRIGSEAASASSAPYSLRSSLGRWRLQPSTQQGAAVRSRGQASEHKWRSNSNNSNPNRNLNNCCCAGSSVGSASSGVSAVGGVARTPFRQLPTTEVVIASLISIWAQILGPIINPEASSCSRETVLPCVSLSCSLSAPLLA